MKTIHYNAGLTASIRYDNQIEVPDDTPESEYETLIRKEIAAIQEERANDIASRFFDVLGRYSEADIDDIEITEVEEE